MLFFLFIFLNKTGFLGLRTFSNVILLHKGLLQQDWVFRLGVKPFFVQIYSFSQMMNSHQGNPFVDTLSGRIGSVANFDTTRLYNVFTYLQTSFGSLLTSLARRGEFKVSSAHRTPNFTNPEYIVCLLFEYSFQIKF